jgi:hypothetical protein
VDGVPLAAWSGPGRASLVVYRSLPVPGNDPAAYAEAFATRLENLPGLRVIRRGPDGVAGAVAARVDVSAPGTGDKLAPTGAGTPVAAAGETLRPTRRVLLAFLRHSDTISLVWHAPEADADALEAQIYEALGSFWIRWDREAGSSY